MSFLRGSGSSVSTVDGALARSGAGRSRAECRLRPRCPRRGPAGTSPSACSESGSLGLSQIFHSELSSSPSRHSAKVCRPSCARGAHLVQHRHAIEKPDHVALVGVLVDVLEVRIERVVVEIEIGVGIGGALPRIGDRRSSVSSTFGLRVLALLRDREWRASSRSRSCPPRR